MLCRETAQAFMKNELKTATLNALSPEVVAAKLELVFQGSVVNDMDPLFRRSNLWEAGVEHIIVASDRKQASGAADEGAAQYLELLQQVAETEAGGALQGSSGPVLEAAGDGEAATAGGIVLMSRFESATACSAFRGLPPVVAIGQGDARSPDRLGELVFEIEGVKDSSTAPTDMGLL